MTAESTGGGAIAPLGEEVVSLFKGARSNLLVVAPFMRSEPLSRLLAGVREGVNINIVTRWRLADILAGATDLGVFDIAASMGADLRLCQELHAKLYVADDRCLVGSANVTTAALGWRKPSNLELLVSIVRSDPTVVAFERHLLGRTMPATRGRRDALLELVDRVGDAGERMSFEENEAKLAFLPTNWLPRTRSPEELYQVYVGDEDASFGLIQAMKDELEEMGIVGGLSKEAFYAWVGEAIEQTRLVQSVTAIVDEDGQVTEEGLRGILDTNQLADEDTDVRNLMVVLERWLTEFLPHRYETASDSIKLVRARRL